MAGKKGITMKMFLFTSLLIVVVVIISLGLLYLMLPSYYLKIKQTALDKNADILVRKLKDSTLADTMQEAVLKFSEENNAVVTSFDNNNNIIVPYSSSFYLSVFQIKQAKSIQAKGEYSVLIKEMTINTADTYLGANISYSDDIYFTRVAGTVKNNNDSSRAISVSSTLESEAPVILITRTIENSDISYLTISSTIQPIDEAKGVIISLMPYLLVMGIVIALVAAYFYAKQFTKPIIKLSGVAVKMQTLEPGIASDIHTNDEFGELSENMDLMYMNLCTNIETLKYEMDKVKALEKSKTDFMQAASHELKTPIAGLSGIVEGMIDSVGKYKNRDQYLLESKKLIMRLSSLVNEILNASRLDTSQVVLEYEIIALDEVIEEILENHSIFAEEKKLKITCDKTNVEVNSDKSILKKVLSNIISNAVKYTPDDGEIRIGATQKAVLYIENQCENVSQDTLQRFFEPFYTRNYSRNRSKSGTGLGLYIVRRSLETLQFPYSLENTELGLKFSIFFGEGYNPKIN